MATTRTGTWGSLFSTAPSSSDGYEIPGAPGWRIIVQVAKVTTTHTTLTLGTYPVPTWVDITGSVFEIEDTAGDPADDTRTPVRQVVIRALDGFTTSSGDPFDFTVSINDRFGTQCYLRWSLYDTNTHGWLPLFGGVIDEVIEEWFADQPARVLELVCYDLMYLVAGHRTPVDFGTLPATVESAVPALLDDMEFMFDGAWSGCNYTTAIQSAANQNALTLFDQIAATCDAFWMVNRGGALRLFDRDLYTDLRSTYYVVDEYTGGGLPSRSATFCPTRMRWINSVDRFTKSTLFDSPNVVGTPAGVATTPVTASRKFTQRRDCPGSDVTTLNTTYADLATQASNAAERYDQTAYLDWADFDTHTAGRGGQPDLADWLYFLQRTNAPAIASYTVMRTRTPTLTHTPRVDGSRSLLTIEHGRFRWQARHYYRRMIV
jgi:hypothetical protein